MQLSREPRVLDRVEVHVDLMPLRQRLVGRYELFDSQDRPTGEFVNVTLSGEWAVRMECSRGEEKRWASEIMMDGSNPNVGTGVYTLANTGQTGHHHVTYRGTDGSILVDGYNLEAGRRWLASFLLKRRN